MKDHVIIAPLKVLPSSAKGPKAAKTNLDLKDRLKANRNYIRSLLDEIPREELNDFVLDTFYEILDPRDAEALKAVLEECHQLGVEFKIEVALRLKTVIRKPESQN